MLLIYLNITFVKITKFEVYKYLLNIKENVLLYDF